MDKKKLTVENSEKNLSTETNKSVISTINKEEKEEQNEIKNKIIESKYFKETKFLKKKTSENWIYSKTIIRILMSFLFVTIILLVVLFVTKISETSQNKISFMWKKKIVNYIKDIRKDLEDFKIEKTKNFLEDDVNFLTISKIKYNYDFIKNLTHPIDLKILTGLEIDKLELEIYNSFNEIIDHHSKRIQYWNLLERDKKNNKNLKSKTTTIIKNKEEEEEEEINNVVKEGDNNNELNPITKESIEEKENKELNKNKTKIFNKSSSNYYKI